MYKRQSDHNILVIDVLAHSTDNTIETANEVIYKRISPEKVKTKFTEKPFVTNSETANSAAQDLEECHRNCQLSEGN